MWALQVGASGRHQFGWRDAMDIVVKWRQLAEPADQVNREVMCWCCAGEGVPICLIQYRILVVYGVDLFATQKQF